MKLFLLLPTFLCSFFCIQAQIPAGYYDSAETLVADDLKAALNNIIDFHVEFPYTSSDTDVWDVLKDTDRDPNNTNNVLGIYSNFSMDASDEYDGGDGWNREHVWAKSRGDFGTSPGAGTDIHHIRAADISTNSARSNRNFDEATNQYMDNSGTHSGMTNSYTGGAGAFTWEPPLDKKGDVARMIFYMATRYEGENGTDPDLELTESLLNPSDKSPLHGKLSVLLQWHEDDPVSDAERTRNNIIYTYQGNRNPFIDRPEFVDRIWGSGTILPLDLLTFTAKFEQSSVRLDWTTANEENVSHFEIEIAENGVDFTKIGEESFSGESSYHYYDHLAGNDQYYRLKTVDIDGTAEYSNIIRVAKDAAEVQVFTVANEAVHIELPVFDTASLEMYTVGGTLVRAKELDSALTKLRVGELVPGNYVIVLVVDGQRSTHTITKF